MIIIGQNKCCITDRLDFHLENYDDTYDIVNSYDIIFAKYKKAEAVEAIINDMAMSAAKGTAIYFMPKDEE